MDKERDTIKFKVIPALNQYFKKYYCELQVIDLRVGINTSNMSEEESQRKVLRSCLSCINKSKPFFIGLLGDRYGWIPPVDLWRQFIAEMTEEEQVIFKHTVGRSVTELEMLYGAIGDPKVNFEHSFFFIRSEDSYTNMSRKSAAFYRDADDPLLNEEERKQRIEKQRILKNRIITISSKRNNRQYYPYSMDWDEKTQAFRNSNEFFKLVYDTLKAEIKKTLSTEDFSNSRWVTIEKNDHDAFISQNTQHKTYRKILTHIHPSQREAYLFTAHDGWGKSILATQIHDLFSKQNHLLLYARTGISSNLLTIRDITIYWINLMARALNTDEPDIEILTNEKRTSMPALFRRFDALCDMASEQHLWVVCILDNMERMYHQTHKHFYIPWLQRPNVSFYGMISSDLTDLWDCDREFGVKRIDIEHLSHDEKEQLIKTIGCKYFIELPETIYTSLMCEKVSPLCIESVFRIFSNISIDDFHTIRSKGDTYDINAYLTELYKKTPRVSSELFRFMISFFIRQLNLSPCFFEVFDCIILSPTGLRESDLEHLFGAEWNPLIFYFLTNLLNGFISEDSILHNWSIRSSSHPRTLMTFPEKEQDYALRIAKMLSKLDTTDPKQHELLIYFSLISKDYELLRPYCSYSGSLIDNRTEYEEFYQFVVAYLFQYDHTQLDINGLKAQLTPNEYAGFLTALYFWGRVEVSHEESLLVQKIQSGLLELDSTHLSLARAHDLGYVLQDIALIKSRLYGNNQGLLIRLASCAYSHCYATDPHYKDVKNMLMATLSLLLTVCINEGKMDEMTDILQQIKVLSTTEV